MHRNPATPVGFMALVLLARVDRLRRGDLSRGASAIEWVIISAVLGALAIAVGVIIYNKVNAKANQINISNTPGGGGGTGT
jgi:hypothetical protein